MYRFSTELLRLIQFVILALPAPGFVSAYPDVQYYRAPDIRHAHLLLCPSPADCPTGGTAEEQIC